MKHKTVIENVQRRATKLIAGFKDLTYEHRLRHLLTLANRRLRGDTIEMYKIITGRYDPEVSDFIKMNTETCGTRHQHKIIYKERSRLNTIKYSFVHRSVDTWNSLPQCVVSAPSTKSVEGRLDKLIKLDYLDNNYTSFRSQPYTPRNVFRSDGRGFIGLISEEDL